MNLLVMLAAAVVVGSSILFRTSHKIGQKNEVLGEVVVNDELDRTEKSTPVPVLSTESSPSPKPTQVINVTLEPTQIVKVTPAEAPTISVEQIFIYPQSSSIGGYKYTSNDSPEKITEWYKNKINTEGYNSKSFVTTKSNEKVLNKLSASKNSQTILIEISRNDSNSQTEIYILLDN